MLGTEKTSGAKHVVDAEPSVDATEGGIIASLWKKIVKDLNYTNVLPYLIVEYVKRHSLEPTVSKSKTKYTLSKNVESTSMTFKVFYDLIFNLLKMQKMKITVELTNFKGNTSTHSITVLAPKELPHEIKTDLSGAKKLPRPKRSKTTDGDTGGSE